jgi:hypothetical protein
MYYEPLTRRGALIVWSMWDVFRKINLVTSMRRCPEFQFIPVIDRAFAFQKVSDGLDTLVMWTFAFAPSGIGKTFMQICFAPTVSVEAPAP